MPIPEDTITDAKDVFMDCAEGNSLELYEIPKHSDLKQVCVRHRFLAVAS